MKKYKVLIVDDEPEARELLEHYLEHLPDCELVGCCKNGVEALQMVNKHPVDLLFLDIQMPGISGVELAKSIPAGVKVIFTTAHREYAVEGFELMAVDYLLKPISLDRFLKAAYRFIGNQPQEARPKESISKDPKREFIFVRADRKMIKVALDQVKYVESIQDYLKIHTSEQALVTRETMAQLQQQLPEQDFLRCHRSFLVNLRHIDSYTHEQITIGRKSIPISRSYKEQTLEKLQSV
ncbi:LytR/AlgR family response regulator transcription factor [Gilvibacter sediminis]|uniref:LytR/AlgR family response regulator transcription factor n=1 Tax=Gilvibacter sediminis TaxID=379071 RepID=UPI00234FE91A|nr:LytTR family DNA-binding domain-containing protein [Gilvibacter sediminis]MDC7998833.1 LytTR family DNA-binding domain-containing protein [Gilvibacter sediminis]